MKLSAPLTVYTSNTYSSGTDTFDIAYRADVTATQMAGAYAAAITYTATANP